MQKANSFWKEKIVVITGSSRGIGRETARKLLSLGAKVMLNGRNSQKLQDTLNDLRDLGPVEGCVSDVASAEGAQELVARTISAFGALDVLINNAGLSMRGPFSNLSAGVVKSVMEANIYGSIFPTMAALPHLEKSNGSVLFVSSVAGLRGFPGVSIYSASKMALSALRGSLSAEYGKQMNFGIVYLGFTENDPDKTVLTSDGQSVRHQRSWQMTQIQAAERILQAVRTKKRSTILTASGKFLSIVQAWFPSLADYIIERSHGKIHQIQKTTVDR